MDRSDLRKVEVKIHGARFKGYFHVFSIYENNAVAIIELENGKVIMISPSDVKFIND